MLLSQGYGRIGKMVQAQPIFSIVASSVVITLSLALIYFSPPTVVLDFDKGYTTPDAPSIEELRAQVTFFGDKGEPWYAGLFAEPKNSSRAITDKDLFKEFKQSYMYMKQNITVSLREDKKTPYVYMDYCGEMCNFNEVFFKTYEMLGMVNSINFWSDPTPLQWPVLELMGYKANIGKHYFKRTMGEGDIMLSSRLAALYFMMFVNSTEHATDLSNYEGRVADYIAEHNADPTKNTTLTLHSAKGMKAEIQRGITSAATKIGFGLLVFLVFLMASLVIMNKVHNRCNYRVLLVGIVAFLLPFASSISGAAVVKILGRHLNTPCFLSPFVTIAVACSCMFLLYNTWLSETKSKRDDPMLEVFAAVMPSLTINLSIAVALIFGVLFPIPELAQLSFFMGVSLIFTFLYLMFFFAPVMVYGIPSTMQLLPQTESGDIVDCWKTKVIEPYTKCLQSNKLKIGAVVVLIAAFLVPCILGAQRVEGNLDYRHLLPPDSPNNKGVHIMSDIVWPEFLHLIFFIESPPNFEDPKQYARFSEMLADFEALPGTMGPSTNMVFIKDFLSFCKTPNATKLDMTQFKAFITDDIYKAWNSGVQYRHLNGTSEITRLVFMVAFNGTRTLADKAVLMTRCREASNKYPEFHAIPFDTEVGAVDVIMQIPAATYILPIVIFSMVFLSFLILVINLTLALVAVFTAVSVYAGTLLIASLFGLTLNPFSVAFILFIAAVSPSYTTHMCYIFAQVGKEKEKTLEVYDDNRLLHTLEKTLLPSVLSAVCSSAMFLPALIPSITIFYYLAVANLLLLIIGFSYSAFVLPIILDSLPAQLTGKGVIFTSKDAVNVR